MDFEDSEIRIIGIDVCNDMARRGAKEYGLAQTRIHHLE
jgi:hypothetical protein